MRKFLDLRIISAALIAALFLICVGSARAANTASGIICEEAFTYDASTNGATKLASAAQSGPMYICGYTIWAGGTANVSIVSGTGTNCATGQVAVTPAYQLTTQTGIQDGSSRYRGLNVIAGQDMCIKTSAGVAVQAIIYVWRPGR